MEKEKKKTENTAKAAPMDPKDIREMIKKTVSKMDSRFTLEQKKEHAKVLVRIFEKGMNPKEAMEFSDMEVCQIWSFAYAKFRMGKYAEARELFKMLILLDPLKSEYATSLGVCYHRLKEFDNAIPFYMMASYLEPNDPVPLFYAYDCFLCIKDKVSAGMMLCNVISRAKADPKYAKILERAQLMLEPLEKQIVFEQQHAAATLISS